MLERKQYKRPPLVEVFCEFFFAPPNDADWDALLMSSFYEKLGKEDYPNKNRLKSVGVQVQLGPVDGPKVRHQGPSTARYSFRSRDGNSIVQVGENLLVVNQLPPYYGWEKFAPEVEKVLGIYFELWRPNVILRAALHYIDKIDIPEETIRLQDYFCFYPILPPELLARPVANLAMAFEAAVDQVGDVLAMAFRQQHSSNTDVTSFILQWDYVATKHKEPTIAGVAQWMDVAHTAISSAFRASLTPKCESLFDGEEDESVTR
jgi:uncharacterized protein (TIGR04255 family)